ncbi:alpha/beta hydrolase fold domain-containing protein [Amycolatopsis sp. H6(2020)]|nr:alpha/beta hydrolase fold domain-containing protein [Amycolatopsis sp. H6(2020)]
MRGGSYLCHDSYCNRYRVAVRTARTPESTSFRTAADLSHTVRRRLVSSWAGDSAGGGLALAVAQTLPAAGRPLPARLVLLSPWLDITMSNPQIRQVERRDPWLSSAGLIEAGQAWAGGDDPHDPRLSPINGPIAGLPPLDLYIGTADVFHPDTGRLREKAAQAGVAIRLTEVDGAFHVYTLAPVPKARMATHAIRANNGQIARGALLVRRSTTTSRTATTKQVVVSTSRSTRAGLTHAGTRS